MTLVVIGNKYLNLRSRTMKVFKISQWLSHKEYHRYRNDIGLIFTAGDMEPEYGAVAFLPLNTEQLHEGTRCLLSGWGRSDHFIASSTNSLQGLIVPIINAETCDKLFHIPGTICAGFDTTTGPSFGDSGGPLRCDDKLAAVVSVGRVSGGPSAYSSMQYHANWINEQSNSLYNGILSLRSFCIQREVVLAFIIYVAFS